MLPSLLSGLQLSLNLTGAKSYVKTSYPIRYGLYHEIRTGDYLVQCNLRGEIKFLSGLQADWPHPSEWLKRSENGDWIYYSTGDYYNGVFDLFGEFYLPCLSYPSNSLFAEKPFSRQAIKRALAAVEEIPGQIGKDWRKVCVDRQQQSAEFLLLLEATGGNYFSLKKERLASILGADITVLPPDSRHVDYEVVPLVLTDGCLYNCDFCTVKAGKGFRVRSRANVMSQLEALALYYGPDLVNYNSLFLGQHDSLAANDGDILFAALTAHDVLRFSASHMRQPRLFLFGSVHSFLGKDEHFFAALDKLPYIVFINLGLESFDRRTLSLLGKPLTPAQVQAAFRRAQQVNRRFPKIELSVNFVLGDKLPDGHWNSLAENLSRQAADGLRQNNGLLFPFERLLRPQQKTSQPVPGVKKAQFS